jgi:hypothetical protein
MTTSVFYDAEARTVDLADDPGGAGGATIATIYNNLSTMLDTGVTLTQQTNNSATSTDPNATFTNTPANGSALVAILCRGGDNVASTNGSWTLLTSAGAAGSRRLEIWWRRAGASEAKLHTWTNATSALWDLTLIEFGGWATKADPRVMSAGANLTTGTSASFNERGILAGIGAVATGGTAGTFLNNGTSVESVTDLPFTTTGRFRAAVFDAWTNRPINHTTSISWTTSRASSRAMVGWPEGNEASTISPEGRVIGNAAQAEDTHASQTGMRFATGTIPDTDTVTGATLTLTSYSGTVQYTTNTPVNVYSLAGAAITADDSNTRTVWKKPTEIQALTRVATRAAGSAWVSNTAYAWTSDATFPAAINKTGDTTLLLATGDQQSGTLRSSQEWANISATVGSVHSLTVVHSFIGSATIAGTATATPTVSGAARYARAIAASASGVASMAAALARNATVAASATAEASLTTTTTFLRTIAGTVAAGPIIGRTVTYGRQITATINAAATAVGTFLVPAAARVLRLAVRSTVRIGQIARANLPTPRTVRIPKDDF